MSSFYRTPAYIRIFCQKLESLNYMTVAVIWVCLYVFDFTFSKAQKDVQDERQRATPVLSRLLSREPERISAQTLYCQKLESLLKICVADTMCLSFLVCSFNAIIFRSSHSRSQPNLGLSVGEDFVILACVVLTQYQRVTDGRTDRQTDNPTVAKLILHRALHSKLR